MYGLILIILFSYKVASGTTLVEYKFGLNYGEIFNDYSTYSRYAVNGVSYLTTSNNSIPTDRGAFFKNSNDDIITLPPNDKATSNFLLPSTFTINAWVCLKEDNPKNYIFVRYIDSKTYLYISKLNNKLLVNIGVGGNDKSCSSHPSSSAFTPNIWFLVSLTIQGNMAAGYLNGISICTITLDSAYTESGIYTNNLGGYNSNSFYGFVWYFSIDDAITYSNYIWDSGNVCIVGGCYSIITCSPGMLNLVTGNSPGCVPGEGSYSTSSDMVSCSCSGVGCNNTNCLTCPTYTCYMSGPIFPSCSTGSYLSGNSCSICYPDCSECDRDLICISCKSSNATPNPNVGCQCNSWYYNTTSLTSLSSCVANYTCDSHCSACTQPYKCTACKAANAIPDPNLGCVCKPGYYNTTSLSISNCLKCYSECSSCINYNTCLACIDPNASPGPTGCSCKFRYGGVHPLSTANSCVLCNQECSSCSDSDVCIVCVAQFAYPGLIGCSCLPGYQGDHPLNSLSSCYKCNSDCLKCNNSQTCIYCADLNSIPNLISGCQCKDGYYYDSKHQCQPCNSLCKLCTSAHNCSECLDNAVLIDSNCSYKLGYNNSSSGYTKKYFSAFLSVDSNNTVTITFSEDPTPALKSTDFKLEINGTTFSYGVNQLNSSVYLIFLKFTKDITQNTVLNLTILTYPLYSASGSQLYNYTYEVNLIYNVGNISPLMQTLGQIASGATKTAAATTIACFLVENPAAGWVLINTIQFITYLPMNDNPLTPGLQNFFNSLGGYNIMPNFMLYVFKSNATSPPYLQASNFGFNTSVFWINAGPTVTVILLLLSFLPVIYLVSKFPLGKIALKLGKYLANYRYGVFLRFWIQAYLDIGFFCLVQLKSVI
jgi:Concanavalin A-like lectin/glucanases superfamily